MDQLKGGLLIPLALGVLFIGTALWNSLAGRHVARRFREWGLAPRLRFGIAGVELLAAILLLIGQTTTWGMLLSTAILLSSIGFCLYKGIYRRLWLSVPMLIAVAVWYLRFG